MFSKPILALDTSAGASVCLCLPDGKFVTDSMTSQRAHSRELLPLLQNIIANQGLAWQDIGAFAVGAGPGSFTGLRVACATMAGINASLDKPMYSLSSLAITARQADTTEPIWAIEDARSGLVYAARYQQGECLEQPQCMTWESFLELQPSVYVSISPVPVALDSWQALPIKLSRELALIQEVQAIPDDAKAQHWVEPLYLQASQAEKNLA